MKKRKKSWMFVVNIRIAHQNLDKVVEKAYGKTFEADEERV